MNMTQHHPAMVMGEATIKANHIPRDEQAQPSRFTKDSSFSVKVKVKNDDYMYMYMYM